MSISTVSVRLAAMCANITGITKAFARIPRKLEDAELPAAVVFPGQATYERAGGDVRRVTRDYQIAVYVLKGLQGGETQGQEAVEPFFERVLDYFEARPGLELNGAALAVLDAQLVSDGGVQAIGFGETEQFIGTTFTIRVTELLQIEYQD